MAALVEVQGRGVAMTISIDCQPDLVSSFDVESVGVVAVADAAAAEDNAGSEAPLLMKK